MALPSSKPIPNDHCSHSAVRCYAEPGVPQGWGQAGKAKAAPRQGSARGRIQKQQLPGAVRQPEHMVN